MEDLRNIPIRERAFTVLREAIIAGDLSPGERLVEELLAERFQVSRTPLREAIHKLELEGFVTRLPKRGVIVAEISVRQARELYDVRSYLDGFAARLTAERLTEPERGKLLQIKKEIALAQAKGDFALLRKHSDEFHALIKDACKHEVLLEHLNKLYPHLLRYRNLAALHQSSKTLAGEEHLSIIELILTGQGAAAEAAMQEHIYRVGASIAEIILHF